MIDSIKKVVLLLFITYIYYIEEFGKSVNNSKSNYTKNIIYI